MKKKLTHLPPYELLLAHMVLKHNVCMKQYGDDMYFTWADIVGAQRSDDYIPRPCEWVTSGPYSFYHRPDVEKYLDEMPVNIWIDIINEGFDTAFCSVGSRYRIFFRLSEEKLLKILENCPSLLIKMISPTVLQRQLLKQTLLRFEQLKKKYPNKITALQLLLCT